MSTSAMARGDVRPGAGVLLMAYGAIGFVTTALTGTYFQMEQRGAGSLATDAPHIVITGALVLLLLAMGFGAFALGRRFRVYSFATRGSPPGSGPARMHVSPVDEPTR